MVIDPVRGYSAIPAGTATVTTAKPARSAPPTPELVHEPADAPGYRETAASLPQTTPAIEKLRPPLNVIMAQLGGQALLGAQLMSGVSVADLPAALDEGLVKAGRTMQATADSLRQVLSAVDAKV